MSKQQINVQPDGATLCAALEKFLTSYADLPGGMAFVLALYAVMTHCFDVFDALAYITLSSPTRGCGKTRVLELLSFTCARARSTVGITPAALFRVIDGEKPTLLVDESESLSGKTDRAEAIREISNAGYKQGCKVTRCEPKKGGKYGYREFDVFGPKVFALIGNLPATLADRSIEVRMQRCRKVLARYRRAQVEPEGRSLHDQINAWVTAHRGQIKAWYLGNDLKFLEGRNEELWLPLFAVCNVMAPGRASDLEAIATECTGTKQADDSVEVSVDLLRHIRTIFLARTNDETPSADLCDALNEDSELPYATWNSGQGIRPNDLARRLRPFGIQSRNLRLGEKVNKGYRRKDFEPVWQSYLPSTIRYTATEGINTGQNGDVASAMSAPV